MPDPTSTVQSLFETAQSLARNVAFDQPTLYARGGTQYNTYAYGYAQTANGAITLVGLSGFAPPAEGEVHVGWSQDGQNYSGAKGYPFAGSVSGFSNPATQYLSVTDCSGFAAYGVENANPRAFDEFAGCTGEMKKAFPDLAQIDQKHTQPWPSAADYAFAGLYRGLPMSWRVVWNQLQPAAEIVSAEPGDVLAWSAAPGSRDTGHVMVAAAAPRPAGPDTFQVEVFDASILPHIDDSRRVNGAFRPGTGWGAVQVGVYGGQCRVGFDAFPPGAGNPAACVSILRLAS